MSENDHDILIRIDERTENMHTSFDKRLCDCETDIDALHCKTNRTRNMLLSLVGVLTGSGVITAGSIWGFG